MNTNTGVPGVHLPRQGEVMPDTVPTVMPGTAVPVAMERVHWGPIWAGLVTTFTSFLVIEMFCYWVGLLTVHAGANGVYTGGSTNPWVSAIVGLIAFFLGGWMAAGSTRVRNSGSGLLNGFLVWALGIVLILAFSALGSGLIFGAAGDAFGQFLSTGMHGTISSGTANLSSGMGITRDGAGWGLLFLVLSGIAAAIGGSFGTMGRRPNMGV